MLLKPGVEQMCGVLINGLSWIDDVEETDLITKLKLYRQELENYANSYVEGEPVVWPTDPRQLTNTCC